MCSGSPQLLSQPSKPSPISFAAEVLLRWRSPYVEPLPVYPWRWVAPKPCKRRTFGFQYDLLLGPDSRYISVGGRSSEIVFHVPWHPFQRQPYGNCMRYPPDHELRRSRTMKVRSCGEFKPNAAWNNSLRQDQRQSKLKAGYKKPNV